MARIIFFSRDYTPHDFRFLEALSKTNHQILYLRLENRGYDHETRAVPSNVGTIPWIGGKTPFHYRHFPKLVSDIKRVINEYQPDLIQAGPLQTSAFLIAISGYHPLVSTSWGYDLLVDAQRNFIKKWITRYVLRHSDAMVGDCTTIRKAAITFGMPDERIITFPWGVDLQHFTPAASSGKSMVTTNELKLLSTRSWESIYGVEEIARAFTQAAHQRSGLHLTMLGAGSQADLLHQIFAQGNISHRVQFPGQISQDKLPKYYQQADVYISASHSDGTSISLLEAMACNCPVIVSDLPGNREWVEHGKQGFLFSTGDTAALANTIVQIYDQRSQLPQMGQSARLLVEQKADWSENFPKLLDAYEIAWKYQASKQPNSHGK